MFGCHNMIEVKLVWLGLSHLCEQFQTSFSRYTPFILQLQKRNWNYLSFFLYMSNLLIKSRITKFLLYWDKGFIALTNLIILNSSIELTLATKRFDWLLFLKWFQLLLTWCLIYFFVILGTTFCWRNIFNH